MNLWDNLNCNRSTENLNGLPLKMQTKGPICDWNEEYIFRDFIKFQPTPILEGSSSPEQAISRGMPSFSKGPRISNEMKLRKSIGSFCSENFASQNKSNSTTESCEKRITPGRKYSLPPIFNGSFYPTNSNQTKASSENSTPVDFRPKVIQSSSSFKRDTPPIIRIKPKSSPTLKHRKVSMSETTKFSYEKSSKLHSQPVTPRRNALNEILEHNEIDNLSADESTAEAPKPGTIRVVVNVKPGELQKPTSLERKMNQVGADLTRMEKNLWRVGTLETFSGKNKGTHSLAEIRSKFNKLPVIKEEFELPKLSAKE